MLKTLLLFASVDNRFYQGAMDTLKRQHNGVELVGVTAGVPIQFTEDGKRIPFIPLNEVSVGGVYDILLVVGAKPFGMSKITQFARQFNLPEEKLLGDWIVCIPGFTLEKYRCLQRSRLSIFSLDCSGSIISNTLGLSFNSPTVNLRMSEEDFMKFIRAPRVYLEEQLIFITTRKEEIEYPVCALGDIEVSMVHYPTFKEAVTKWNERKQRINWSNLFVIAYTENEKTLQEFDALPYDKKVCFVPFKSDLDSAWYIDTKIYWGYENLPLGAIVHRFVWLELTYYDLFDMLLYVKKTPLIEM